MARRLAFLALAPAFALMVAGCGSWWEAKPVVEKPNLVADPNAGKTPPPAPASAAPVATAPAPAPTEEKVKTMHLKPVPYVPRPHVPAPVGLVHPPEAPIKAPSSLPASEKQIPVNIVGNWQDDRGADLTFTEDGRFEIDAHSPDGSNLRATGNYLVAGGRATMTYAGVDIETSNPQTTQMMPKIKEEFMTKGPGKEPQIEAIEMKSKDEFVMRLQNPGASPTVIVMKRKA